MKDEDDEREELARLPPAACHAEDGRQVYRFDVWDMCQTLGIRVTIDSEVNVEFTGDADLDPFFVVIDVRETD